MAKLDPKAPVTNETFFGTIEHLLDRVDEMMDKKLARMQSRMDERFDKAGTERQDLKRQIDDLKSDVANAPSRKEFKNLEAAVERLHLRPTH